LLYSGTIGHGSFYVTCLDTGIGIYSGLFHSTAITHSFDLFIYIIAAIILLLTAFYPRSIVQPSNTDNIYNVNNSISNEELPENSGTFYSKGYTKAYRNAVIGVDAPQFTILEYSAIILFILFLAIELQSYGLYIFATLYRNSE
jgi:NADH-ubiquinone oxidoreductase chain 2